MPSWFGRWSERAQNAADQRIALHADLASDEVMSQEQAARELGRSGVCGLILLGVLEQGVMANGFQGVTRESVEREAAWRRSTTRGQRMRRRAWQVLVKFFPY